MVFKIPLGKLALGMGSQGRTQLSPAARAAAPAAFHWLSR